MNDFIVYKSIHFPDELVKQITETYHDENYQFKDGVKVIIDEVIQFFKQNKETHNIQYIKVELSKWTILMERYNFYNRCLLNLGFEQKDKELFILKVE